MTRASFRSESRELLISKKKKKGGGGGVEFIENIICM